MANICSYLWYDGQVIGTLRSLLDRREGCRVEGLDEIVAVRQLLDRFEAQWLTGLSELAHSGETETVCGMSTTDWLATTTRCTRPEARAKLNVAKRLAATTLIQHELADGELSLSQATLLVRGRTKRTADYFDEHEPFLTATAKNLSADQLAVLIAQWHRRADAATADTADTDVMDRRELFLTPVGTTEWMLRGTLTAEQGDLVNEAPTAISQTEHDGANDTLPHDPHPHPACRHRPRSTLPPPRM